MTVRSPLAAAKTLGLIERLRSTLREMTSREGKLEQEIQSKLSAARQIRDKAVTTARQHLAERTAVLKEELQRSHHAARERHERRKPRITEAHKSSRKLALKRVETQEGSYKYKLQTEVMGSKRTREVGLAAASRRFEELQNQLSQQETLLLQLEDLAADAFRGYRSFSRLLTEDPKTTVPDLTADEEVLLGRLTTRLNSTEARLVRFRRFLLPALFKYTPAWLILVFAQFAVVPLLPYFNISGVSFLEAGISVAVCLILGLLLHLVGRRQSRPDAEAVAAGLSEARKFHEACLEKSSSRHTGEQERIEAEYLVKSQGIEDHWSRAVDEAESMRGQGVVGVDQKEVRARARNERLLQLTLDRSELRFRESVGTCTRDQDARIEQLNATCSEKESRLNQELDSQWQILETDWKSSISTLYREIAELSDAAQRLFLPWDAPDWAQWTPPATFPHVAPLGYFDVDIERLADGVPASSRLPLPTQGAMRLPLLLAFPDQGSLLLETSNVGRDDAMHCLNNLILRLLSSAPAGRLSFTIVDPVGLGQNFAGVMHLADHAEQIINRRIWTQADQIEQRLGDLNEHMEKVIQMYLRNEYPTIADYNEQAGTIAEKYHFLVVADFPAGFSDLAAKRLVSIAATGAKCGVYTLIHWDHRSPLPQDFSPAELHKSSLSLTCRGKDVIVTGNVIPGAKLRLESAPPPDFATELIHRIGRANKDSNRVEVPFSDIAPADGQLWREETTSELRVSIGRTGATKLQYLAIGKGTRQHALLAGKTGSGKSTLLHVIITNLALWCSPEQVEFYLIDFKKGVEFKCYATLRLPHARVVAIESDREFGLSVLQRVDDELKRRGDLFRKLGVQDIPGYKRAGGTESMPRSLLMIDEFQELFIEDDKVSQTASVLLDRIVRQGRAFGIHVILGSQTLGGAYTVARATLGQMVIRIALQCNEADAYLIMDENNSAPRLLSRPGEGIYNDMAGALEGNSPFQVVWLPDDVRDRYLRLAREKADETPSRYPGPFVFEGDAPAEVRENPELQAVLRTPPRVGRAIARIWMGSPNSIKGPTEMLFQRQSGSNLLLVGQREEATLALLSVAMISLAAQYPAGSVRFVLFDGTAPGSSERDYLDRVVAALPHEVILARDSDVVALMNQLVEEMKQRGETDQAARGPETFILVHGLQKYKKLRQEEEFSFSADESGGSASAGVPFNALILDGPSMGFHVIATCDTYNNVNRFLNRKALGEFEMRVLFQMSANDSASLIDTPKASTLGLHRAIYYNEQQGYLELFRPYALPSVDWVESVSTRFQAWNLAACHDDSQGIAQQKRAPQQD